MDSIFTLKDLAASVFEGRWQGSIATEADADVGMDVALRRAAGYCGAVKYQDKVLVLVSNTVDTVAAVLTVWHRGGVVVPVKRDAPQSALRDIIDDCGAQHMLDPEAGELSPTADIRSRVVPGPPFHYLTEPRLTGVDLALIIYTSGSTGKPKGIMLTHGNVVSALRSILCYLGIRRDDTILLISPLSFDYGLYQLLFCLATECRLVMCRKGVNAITVASLIEKRGITVLPLIPALATGLHKYLEKFRKQLHGVRLITSTGGVLPARTALGLKQFFVGAKVVKMYGLTETKRVSYLPAEYLERASDSVGIPKPGLEAKVFQEVTQSDGSIVLDEMPRGQIGQLFVRGSSVFQRYFNPDNDGGAKIFPGLYRDDNWLATGDLFMQDEEGLLYFKGRTKDVIKQRGFCLYPRDLESIVYRSPLVEICAVTGAVDSDGNEIAKLFVTLAQHDESTQNEFSSWLQREIDRDYMFGQVQFVEAMPLSANGKVDVSALVKVGIANP